MNQPVIIIGAGRSGTNILRDSICSLPGFETWPCDEINYIWRHGNIGKATDRFTPEDARPSVKKFIRSQFEKFQRSSGAGTVVEKTCANSLRVAFINEILPGARYIFIVRNGYDVTSSAMARWRATLDLDYILKKARYVPKSDIPYYASRYLANRIKKFFPLKSAWPFGGHFTRE
ncbi:MAG: sulfotransferase [Owenweeksia sp.]|nr:sulfotransferase [Owenweeksia sp.]